MSEKSEESEVAEIEDKDRRFISFFQSVITIGIMNNAKSIKEAEQKALQTMKDPNGVNYCAFNQTPFELTDSDSWDPELELDPTTEGLSFRFNPNENTKNIIATRLQKDITNLTDKDYEEFVKMSIDLALK